jgi:pimeloyl-ACP methyl ester carboxylesterase
MPTPTHLPARKITDTKATLIPSLESPPLVIVFVHGYGGGPRTWNDFPQLLSATPRTAGVDLIFFNYDGIYSELNASALL